MANEISDIHKELKILIDDTSNKELECRAYLKYARDLLVDVTTATYLDEAEEYRGHSGDSDYLIVCQAKDEAGIDSNKAYIWEIKAPQCYLFEQDTQNRVRPTKEYISAENQLLHYYEESKGSTQFREEFNITHPEDVKLGGLIIGCKRTWVKSPDYSQSKLAKLYRRALDLRRRHLYGRSGIKVMIWDHILDYLRPEELPIKFHAEFRKAIKIPNPNYTVVSSGS